MIKQTFCLVLLFAMCLSIPLAATAQTVDIPDPNLRAATEVELGKAPGATITVADMATLTIFFPPDTNITDLTGLGAVTNLASLEFRHNNISDTSPLVAYAGPGNGNWADVTANPSHPTSIWPPDFPIDHPGLRLDIDIPDRNLRAVINEKLGKAPDATVLPEDMKTLTELDASNRNISNLTGLEAAINLTILDLGTKFLGDLSTNSNSISDLSPLAGLTNLTDLRLRQNSVSDISALAGLTNLEVLYLGTNSISNISPLAGLTQLMRLEINNNSISDITPLAGLTNLTELALWNNSISDLSPLVANTGLGSGDYVGVNDNPLNAESINTHIPSLQSRGVTVSFDKLVDIPDPNLRAVIEDELGKAPGTTISVADMEHLTELFALNANISDLTGLEAAINLTWLDLGGELVEGQLIGSNSISDLSPLAGLTNLTALRLSENSISDISAVRGLINLTYLALSNNSISDISAVAGLTNLTELWLYNNSISDIFPVSALTDLTKLALYDNPISDISPIAGLTNLTQLLFHNNSISDISAIAALTNLTELRLSENSVSDISAVRGLINLTYLGLSNNSISDISAIAELTDLTELWLYNNSISDISPVSALTNLTKLALYNNPISDISPIAGLTNLTQLLFHNNSISDISAITGLTHLTELWISANSVSDISAVAGLTNLTELYLHGNSISDLSPLVENTGLGNGDLVDVRDNFLNALSINTYIPALQSRGVTVDFHSIVVRPEDITQTVDIPDPNLRAAIAKTRGKAPDAAITVADLMILIELQARNANISDLTGLEYATNLTHLYLDGEDVEAEDRFINSNSVSDLSPLAGLIDMRLLTLEGNNITDISVIAGLTNLITLNLGDNNISDISAIAGLTNLQRLGLYGNPISDISSVSGLANLTVLALGINSITDISALAGLTNLTHLWLFHNSISDISPLAGLTQLTYLHLRDNSISDISPLVQNTGLGSEDSVNVAGNPLNAPAIHIHIPVLQGRGVIVEFDDIVAQPADINGDGSINIFDLVAVGAQFGVKGQNLTTDVNRDGIVDVRDLVLVAGMFGEAAAAPSTQPQAAKILTAAAVREWLTDAKAIEITDPIMRQGLMVLQQLLAALTPTETQLLANYPNPFNPETWIPYRLAEDAFVTLTIYDGTGRVVRAIDVGHQTAAFYESRSQAIYWDGRNQIGEQVASGVYFYHLSAGDYSATRKMLILK